MATFKGRRKRAKLEVRHESGIIDVASRYCHSLQLYAFPPTEELSLVDFELFAAERLKGTNRCFMSARHFSLQKTLCFL